MIIYGWRGITSTKGQGTFHCPRCGPERNYKERSVRRWFTLYFLPVIPLDHVGKYVECQRCQGKFIPEVLMPACDLEVVESLDSNSELAVPTDIAAPRGGSPGTDPLEQARRIFVLAALANGEPHDATLGALQSACQGISGVTLQKEQLRQEVRLAQQARTDMNSFAAKIAYVFEAGLKPKIIAGVHIVLVAQRGETQSTNQLLRQLGQTLGMSSSEITAILEVLRQQ